MKKYTRSIISQIVAWPVDFQTAGELIARAAILLALIFAGATKFSGASSPKTDRAISHASVSAQGNIASTI